MIGPTKYGLCWLGKELFGQLCRDCVDCLGTYMDISAGNDLTHCIMNDLVNLAWNAWTNCLGNAWTNCLGNDWTNCVGNYWTNCVGNYWTNCVGNYWTNCVGNYWTNCVGNYWTNELVLPLYGLTLNKDKLIFSGERLLKSTSISFGFLNKEMF